MKSETFMLNFKQITVTETVRGIATAWQSNDGIYIRAAKPRQYVQVETERVQTTSTYDVSFMRLNGNEYRNNVPASSINQAFDEARAVKDFYATLDTQSEQP